MINIIHCLAAKNPKKFKSQTKFKMDNRIPGYETEIVD